MSGENYIELRDLKTENASRVDSRNDSEVSTSKFNGICVKCSCGNVVNQINVNRNSTNGIGRIQASPSSSLSESVEFRVEEDTSDPNDRSLRRSYGANVANNGENEAKQSKIRARTANRNNRIQASPSSSLSDLMELRVEEDTTNPNDKSSRRSHGANVANSEVNQNYARAKTATRNERIQSLTFSSHSDTVEYRVEEDISNPNDRSSRRSYGANVANNGRNEVNQRDVCGNTDNRNERIQSSTSKNLIQASPSSSFSDSMEFRIEEDTTNPNDRSSKRSYGSNVANNCRNEVNQTNVPVRTANSNERNQSLTSSSHSDTVEYRIEEDITNPNDRSTRRSNDVTVVNNSANNVNQTYFNPNSSNRNEIVHQSTSRSRPATLELRIEEHELNYSNRRTRQYNSLSAVNNVAVINRNTTNENGRLSSSAFSNHPVTADLRVQEGTGNSFDGNITQANGFNIVNNSVNVISQTNVNNNATNGNTNRVSSSNGNGSQARPVTTPTIAVDLSAQDTGIVTTILPKLIAGPYVGPSPQKFKCSYCTEDVCTRITQRPSLRTHLMAACLCLIGCWCCICVPYCMESCNNIDHYCPECGVYLGTYRH